MDEIRVAIIDDHAIVRQGLRAMIDREPDLQVVGEAPSARLAPAMLDRTRPRVVLLDLRLTAGSECDGLSLCATITQRYPDIRVLVLTSSADEWLILESIKQGAKGFVVKDVDLTELVRAIRAVHRGESAFDSRSAGVVVRWMHGSQRTGGPAASDITPREREILVLLARGLSNVAIGQRLYISAATVKFHVGNVMAEAGRAAPRRGRVRGQQARPDLTGSWPGSDRLLAGPGSAHAEPGHLPPRLLRPSPPLLLSGVAAGALSILACGLMLRAQNPVPGSAPAEPGTGYRAPVTGHRSPGTGHSRVVTALTSV